MPQIKIPLNRIQYLIDEMENRFDSTILKRGWEYFHQGRVGPLELRHGFELHAEVRGNKRYEAKLDLEDISRSDCTCPYGDMCKHMAALLFQAYAPLGRPELLLRQMQQAIRSRGRGSRAAAARAAKKTGPAEIAPTDSPRQWQQFFDRRFYGFSLSHQQSIEAFASAALETLEPLSAAWDGKLKPLYSLHVLLFMMRRIDRFFRENQSSYLSYYHETGCRTAAANCRSKLADTVGAMNPDALREAYPEQWEETIDLLGEIVLEGTNGAVDWLDVYRLLWWDLFTGKEERGKEKERLKRLIGQPGLTHRKKDLLLHASAHFYVMAGDDESALAQLNGLHDKQVGDFYTILHKLAQTEQWNRLLLWLRWLLSAMARAKQEDFHRVCGYWMEVVKHLPSDEEWIRVMQTLLPRSYYYYTDYLMRSGRYRQWIDLQLSNRISPANLYSAQLKAVEEAEPELLLPLYHQAVERSILEKNRASYKTAVRFLRKLHTCYKKMKQPDRWDEYINRLAGKYSRLRAFQDELQKGKWLR